MIQAEHSPSWVHIVGVGGSATSGLARILSARGVEVTGSDRGESPSLPGLRDGGIRVAIGHDRGNLAEGVDLVVHSAAVPEGNPELEESRSRGLPVLKYAQFLGRLLEKTFGIAVAGTHGKTTTAGMLTSIFIAAGRDPTVLIGGRHPLLGGNWRQGRDAEFIVEACEFDRSFHSLHPRAAIITNLEHDHPDTYPDLASLEDAFRGFAGRLRSPGVLVVNGDSPILRGFGAPEGVERETFGFGARRDWRALRSSHGAPAGFEVFHRNRPWGQVTLSVPGRHSVANALAAIALAEGLGIPRSAICEGLRLFPGIERRFQHLGAVGGIDLVDDYAHHPTELSSTLATAREVFPGRRVWAVFQPHQLGRLRAFGGAFAAALGAADGVGLLPVYSVREEASDFPGNLLGELEEGVRRNGVPVVRFHSLVEASDSLTALMEPGDVCLTLGAGDLRPLTEGLRRRLGGGWSGC